MEIKGLVAARKYFEDVAGSWNGEDARFIGSGSAGGEEFVEEDAGYAKDIVEKIDELKELLDNFQN